MKHFTMHCTYSSYILKEKHEVKLRFHPSLRIVVNILAAVENNNSFDCNKTRTEQTFKVLCSLHFYDNCKMCNLS